jgi:hypothetical protein
MITLSRVGSSRVWLYVCLEVGRDEERSKQVGMLFMHLASGGYGERRVHTEEWKQDQLTVADSVESSLPLSYILCICVGSEFASSC